MKLDARRLFVWVFLPGLLLGPAEAHAATPNVVVTLKPVHALAAGVMAGIGEPRLLVEGAASPHTFALKPSAARAIEGADIFVRVSEAVEPFTRKIAETLPKSVTLITLADRKYGVELLNLRAGGVFEAHIHHGDDDHDTGHEDHDADHDHDARDGHIWLDPVNAKAIVGTLADVLAARDSEHAETYRANAAKLAGRLDALEAEIEGKMAPLKGKSFIVFHDATQYFEKRFGLQASGAISLSPEQQASAKRLSEIRQKIKDAGAACVFAEPGFQPNLVEAVREGTNAKTGALDPEGLLLDPGPELYFTLMKSLASAFQSCLSGAP